VSGISYYLPAAIKNRSAWRLKIIYFLQHHLTGETHTANFDALTEHHAAAQAAHAQFLAGQTPDLPKLQLQLRELKWDDIDLEIGRPRAEAYIVHL
jgi:hypothetical protein